MEFLIGLAVVAALVFALAWRRHRRGRPLRELTMNEDYERAKGLSYLQALHTRNDHQDPFH